MDDLSQQLSQILSDPQQLQQLQSMASALGLGQAPAQPEPEPRPAQGGGVDSSLLSGLLGAVGGGSQPQSPEGPDPYALQLIGRISPLLNRMREEDDQTRLLKALRPLLSEGRRKKLDEASRLLQMMRLLPLLRESGIFSGKLP